MKSLVIIIVVVSAVCAWIVPFGLVYGIIQCSLLGYALVLSHTQKYSKAVRASILFVLLFFFGMLMFYLGVEWMQDQIISSFKTQT